MSTTDTPPVTLDRVIEAVEAVGLIPFISFTGQVAAILPNRTVRIAVPEGSQAQGDGRLAGAVRASDHEDVLDAGQGSAEILDGRGRGRHDDRPHSPGT